MAHLEETVLKSESGINLNRRGEKKYNFNPPGGTLILTDQRLIFAQSGGEFLKRLVVGGVLGGIIGSEAMRGATRVKKEDLDKAMERSESFEIHLQGIIGAKVEKQFGASLLCIDCSTPGMSRAQLYRAGAVSSFKGFDDWIGEINSAKQRVATMPQQAPQPMYTPTPMQAPQLIQGMPNTRFCPSCGQPINQQDKFCLNCGANLQAQPAVCPKCGNAVNPGQKFCNMCGTQMR